MRTARRRSFSPSQPPEQAWKNWKAIQLTGNATVAAVASRDAERSRRFIAECEAEAPMEVLPQAFGRYDDLLASELVEAVYIPLPTGVRKEWVLRAAAAGKHVVCQIIHQCPGLMTAGWEERGSFGSPSSSSRAFCPRAWAASSTLRRPTSAEACWRGSRPPIPSGRRSKRLRPRQGPGAR